MFSSTLPPASGDPRLLPQASSTVDALHAHAAQNSCQGQTNSGYYTLHDAEKQYAAVREEQRRAGVEVGAKGKERADGSGNQNLHLPQPSTSSSTSSLFLPPTTATPSFASHTSDARPPAAPLLLQPADAVAAPRSSRPPSACQTFVLCASFLPAAPLSGAPRFDLPLLADLAAQKRCTGYLVGSGETSALRVEGVQGMPDRRAVIWAAPKTPPEYTLVPMEAATQTDMIWVNGVSLRAPYSVFLTDGAIIEIGRRGDPKLSWLFRTGMSISTLLVQTRVVVSVSAPSLESSSSAAPLCEAAAPPPPTSRQPVSLASFSTPSTSRTAPGLAPASFRPWTADEEALLRRLRFEDARPMMDIASALGRSKDEVERWMDYSCPRWKKEGLLPARTRTILPSPASLPRLPHLNSTSARPHPPNPAPPPPTSAHFLPPSPVTPVFRLPRPHPTASLPEFGSEGHQQRAPEQPSESTSQPLSSAATLFNSASVPPFALQYSTPSSRPTALLLENAHVAAVPSTPSATREESKSTSRIGVLPASSLFPAVSLPAFAPPTATNSASPSPPVPMLFFPPPSSAASAFATPTISKRPLSPSPSTVRTEDGAGRQEMKQLRVGKDPFARWKEVRRASRAFVRGAREDWAAEQGEKV